MKKIEYQVSFVTPAFLGNAEQQAQWRTPPFKALLRQWWRVREAAFLGYDYKRVREEEGKVFGHAWLKMDSKKTWAMKSQVLLRLDEWRPGRMKTWLPTDPQVSHPEVNRPSIGAHLYLGYGPLSPKKGGTSLKMTPAIQENEGAKFYIAHPEELADSLRDTLQLLHWFGTVGSRSRNGWGSFALEGDGIVGYEALTRYNPLVRKISRKFRDCLQDEWPHALGEDDQGVLLWRTKDYGSWSEVMKTLAEIKIDFRVNGLPFSRNKNAKIPRIDERHVVAYPITHHDVQNWEKARLANQLRFKVARQKEKYYGFIYHLPCKIPSELLKDLTAADRGWITNRESNIWEKVHHQLDRNSLISRI